MTTQALQASPLTPTPTTRRERRTVTGRVKRAVDLMVWQGAAWNDAAIAVNLTTQSMRKALERPNVLRYLREQREVLRASASARNVLRLCEIRDQDDNKAAAVQAVRALERIGEDDSDRRATPPAPGFVVVINTQPAKPLTERDISPSRTAAIIDASHSEPGHDANTDD